MTSDKQLMNLDDSQLPDIGSSGEFVTPPSLPSILLLPLKQPLNHRIIRLGAALFLLEQFITN
jgi:hypothetical protein